MTALTIVAVVGVCCCWSATRVVAQSSAAAAAPAPAPVPCRDQCTTGQLTTAPAFGAVASFASVAVSDSTNPGVPNGLYIAGGATNGVWGTEQIWYSRDGTAWRVWGTHPVRRAGGALFWSGNALVHVGGYQWEPTNGVETHVFDGSSSQAVLRNGDSLAAYGVAQIESAGYTRTASGALLLFGGMENLTNGTRRVSSNVYRSRDGGVSWERVHTALTRGGADGGSARHSAQCTLFGGDARVYCIGGVTCTHWASAMVSVSGDDGVTWTHTTPFDALRPAAFSRGVWASVSFGDAVYVFDAPAHAATDVAGPVWRSADPTNATAWTRAAADFLTPDWEYSSTLVALVHSAASPAALVLVRSDYRNTSVHRYACAPADLSRPLCPPAPAPEPELPGLRVSVSSASASASDSARSVIGGRWPTATAGRRIDDGNSNGSDGIGLSAPVIGGIAAAGAVALFAVALCCYRRRRSAADKAMAASRASAAVVFAPSAGAATGATAPPAPSRHPAAAVPLRQ